MNAAALLDELAEAGVTVTRNGDHLHYQTRPGVRIAPYRERIRQVKPALLALLQEREAIAALGLDPALHWVHVSQEPVEPSVPPEGWEGVAPDGCGTPLVCGSLGPCRHFTEHGRCWAEGDRP